MNISKKLTDQAIKLLEIAVVHVLAKARKRGVAYLSAAEIGRAMGIYNEWKMSNHIYTTILCKLEIQGKVEAFGESKIGWRLTDAEWDRFRRLG